MQIGFGVSGGGQVRPGFAWMLLVFLLCAWSSESMAGLTTQSVVGTTADGASDASSASTSSTSESSSGDDDDDEQERTARRFIEHNHDPLQSDLARGHGEHLDALMGIYSCSGASLVTAIRADMAAQLSTAQTQSEQDTAHPAHTLHRIVRRQVREGPLANLCVG